MRFVSFIAKSLWFHRRSHASVLLATAVATTVLVGALVVGDCVRQTLRLRATERLCGCQLAMVTNSPFGGHLRETWRRMKTLMPTAVPPITAAILLKGSVSVSGGGRASAEVIGFEDYQGVIGNSIGPAAGGERMEMPDGAVVNEAWREGWACACGINS